MTIRFVQFPHPGSEHKPETKNGNKFWSPTTRQPAVHTGCLRMYSFFPAILAGDKTGFKRPHIELPEKYFNSKLQQGVKGVAADSGSLRV